MEGILRLALNSVGCPTTEKILLEFMTFLGSYSGPMRIKNIADSLELLDPKSISSRYLAYLVVFYVFKLHEIPQNLTGISFEEIELLLSENPIRKELNQSDKFFFEKIYHILIFLNVQEMRKFDLGRLANVCRALITFVSGKLCTSQTGGKVNGLIVWVMDIFRIIFEKPKFTRRIVRLGDKKRPREDTDSAVYGLLLLKNKKDRCEDCVGEDEFTVIFSKDGVCPTTLLAHP